MPLGEDVWSSTAVRIDYILLWIDMSRIKDVLQLLWYLYLAENFFIGPAFLYSDTYTTLYQNIGPMKIRTKKHDSDFRFYAIAGYYPTKSTIIYGAVELVNDLMSDEYYRDYSQYNTSVILYQFISKDTFLFLKYEQALRDKRPTSTVSGNRDYIGYGFGLGMRI